MYKTVGFYKLAYNFFCDGMIVIIKFSVDKSSFLSFLCFHDHFVLTEFSSL